MRKDELFDTGVRGNLADDGGGHVQAALYAGGAFRNRVVGDEKIGVGSELWKAAIAVGVAAEDDGLAADFDAPSQRGNGAMDDASGGNGEIIEMEYGRGLCGARDIVRLQLVATLLARHEEFAEIAVCTARLTEEIGDKFSCGGHEVVARRAVDGKRTS